MSGEDPTEYPMRVEYLGMGHLRVTLSAAGTHRFKVLGDGARSWVRQSDHVAEIARLYPVRTVVVWSENTDEFLAEWAFP